MPLRICTSENAYQVRIAMDQEEMVYKTSTNIHVEIARFNIPHTFLVVKIAPNCILRKQFSFVQRQF